MGAMNDTDMAYVIGALMFAMFVAMLVLSGCTVTHETPSADRAIKLAERWVDCPAIKLPPIPQDVVIDIKGNKVTANEGGETILKGYVACRSAYH